MSEVLLTPAERQTRQTDENIRQIHTGITKQINLLKQIFENPVRSATFDIVDSKNLKSIFQQIEDWLFLLDLLTQNNCQGVAVKEEIAQEFALNCDDSEIPNPNRVIEGAAYDEVPGFSLENSLTAEMPQKGISEGLEATQSDDPTLDVCDEDYLHDQSIKIEFEYNEIDEYPDEPVSFETMLEEDVVRIEYESNQSDIDIEELDCVKHESECLDIGRKSIKKPELNTRNHTAPRRTRFPEGCLVCYVCNQSFRLITKLREHLRRHSRFKACKTCGKEFNNPAHLASHVKTHSAERSLICDICGNAFAKRAHIQRHLRTHTGEKPFKCQICGKSYSQQTDLKRHSYSHTGEKPFECDICGLAFAQRRKLKIHYRTHTGERPYKCDICQLAFSRRESLSTHSRIHSGEKAFKCNICGKAFTQREGRTRHLKTHSGEKPFGCDVCGKAFSRNENLRTHYRIHSGERPFKCEICGKAFAQQTYMKVHLKVHTDKR